jgi:UDP:flavonoid glycosyltransferase YjiC (YdhE family)
MSVPTILFAWELGLGAGHLANIRRIAARLKPHASRIIAAVPDPAAASGLRGLCDAIIAAPGWPPASKRHAPSSATLNDILSARGLADLGTLRHLLLSWDEILRRVRPDLVIADLAPAAALATRGRVPLLIVGNGYTLPPSGMKRFPPLHRIAEPRWNEDATLSAVNDALGGSDRPRLDHLPELFAGDARSVQTFALLDPYDMQRQEPLDGPLFDCAPIARAEDAENIFVYISGSYPVPKALEAALRPFANRVHICAPGSSDGEFRELSRAGATIHRDLVRLQKELSSSRLVIHTGGSGVAAEALSAGVPQLILSSHIEQDLTGEALQRVGLGRLIRAHEVTSLSADLIAMLLADVAMSARAHESGHLHRSVLSRDDPALRCEQKILALLQR